MLKKADAVAKTAPGERTSDWQREREMDLKEADSPASSMQRGRARGSVRRGAVRQCTQSHHCRRIALLEINHGVQAELDHGIDAIRLGVRVGKEQEIGPSLERVHEVDRVLAILDRPRHPQIASNPTQMLIGEAGGHAGENSVQGAADPLLGRLNDAQEVMEPRGGRLFIIEPRLGPGHRLQGAADDTEACLDCGQGLVARLFMPGRSNVRDKGSHDRSPMVVMVRTGARVRSLRPFVYMLSRYTFQREYIMIVKKRGRPPADTEQVLVRMSNELIEKLDKLRREAEDLPSRPEVVRRLVEKALRAGEDGSPVDDS